MVGRTQDWCWLISRARVRQRPEGEGSYGTWSCTILACWRFFCFPGRALESTAAAGEAEAARDRRPLSTGSGRTVCEAPARVGYGGGGCFFRQWMSGRVREGLEDRCFSRAAAYARERFFLTRLFPGEGEDRRVFLRGFFRAWGRGRTRDQRTQTGN